MGTPPGPLRIRVSDDRVLVDRLLQATGVAHDAHGERALVARSPDGVALGVTTWQAATCGDIETLLAKMPPAAASRTRTALAAEQVGLLCKTSVVPGSQGRGVGTALLRARFDDMGRSGVTVALGTCWLHPRRRTFELYLQMGLTHVASLPGYWSSRGCRDCGSSCRCTAAVVVGWPDG